MKESSPLDKTRVSRFMSSLLKKMLESQYFGRAIRYGLVGGVLNALIYAAYVIVTYFWPHPQAVMTTLYALGTGLSYIINKRWAYRDRNSHHITLPLYILAYLSGYIVQLSILTLLHNGLGVAHYYAQLIAIPVTAGYLFSILNWVVFPLLLMQRKRVQHEIIGASILMLIAFFLRIYLQYNEIFSSSLYADDLVIFPAIGISGFPAPTSSPAFFTVLHALIDWLEEPHLVRLALCLMLSVIPVFLYTMMALTKLTEIDRGLIALAAFFTPTLVSQAVFINGSHPSVGFAIACIGYVAATYFWRSSNSSHRGVLFCVAMFFLLTSVFSTPMAGLVALPLVALPILDKSRNSFARTSGMLMLAFSPTVILFAAQSFSNLFINHYVYLEGFTVYSLGNVVNQLQSSIGLVLKNYFSNLLSVYWIVLWSLASFITVFIIRYFSGVRPEIQLRPSEFVPPVFFIFCAAVWWGPIGFVTSAAPRYVGIPVVLTISAIASFAFLIFRGSERLLLFYRALLVFLVISSLATTRLASQSQFEAVFDFGEALSAVLEAESRTWDEGAQIIVLSKEMPQGFTYGYPHWSTWFVRRTARRQDILAHVSADGIFRDNPFIADFEINASDFGYDESFWTIQNGKSRRKKLAGLILEVPTYFYEWDGEKLAKRDLLVIVGKNGAAWFSAYARFGDYFSKIETGESFCELRSLPNVRTLQFYDNSAPYFSILKLPIFSVMPISSSFDLSTLDDDQETLHIDFEPDINSTAFRLEYIEQNNSVDPVVPGTIMKWGEFFRVSLSEDDYYEIQLGETRRFIRSPAENLLTIDVEYVRGCFLATRVNNRAVLTMIGPPIPDTDAAINLRVNGRRLTSVEYKLSN